MKLEFRDVSIGYDKDAPIQRGVNFSVESGEVCCVLGPNGCGKTTLIKTALGLNDLIHGAITVDGDDITQWSAQRLAASMAYVSQSHDRPFPYLVKDVVMLGRISEMDSRPSPEDRNIVYNALHDMGIYHLRNTPYMDISGGELQMVMFARALAQQPEMLILDEPTSALDYGNVVRVIEKVRQLARAGYAIMMITHSPDHAFMTGANVALFMRNDPMIFGRAQDVITTRNIQKAYGVGVKIVNFTHENNEPMRMCAPVFMGDEALRSKPRVAGERHEE